MKICTTTDIYDQRFGMERAIEIIAQNGFDYADFSMFPMNNPDHDLCNGDYYLRYAKWMKEKAESCGISFWQAHAPFPSYIVDNDNYNEFIVKAIKRSIEMCGILGVYACVVHPITRYDEDLQQEQNFKLYRELEPVAEANGVKIALENMWGFKDGKITHAACSKAEQFNAYLDALGSKNFTACLDLGHCGLVGTPAQDMIRDLGGDRLTVLHVHDNNNIDDLHTLPFTKSMDWREITKALHDINYKGVLTFEADSFIASLPVESTVEASKMLESTGRLLASMTGL